MSSWYVEGTSTTLALSATEGWTNVLRASTTVLRMALRNDRHATLREVLDSIVRLGKEPKGVHSRFIRFAERSEGDRRWPSSAVRHK